MSHCQLHYLLGYEDAEFVLKKGSKWELKVDYFEKYEKVRIKNNYPRVRGTELADLTKEVQDEDREFVDHCTKASYDEIQENLAFLKTFSREQESRGKRASKEARQRALFVGVVSMARLDSLGRRLKNLLRKLADAVEPAAKTKLFNNALFRGALEACLGISTCDEFLASLEAMCRRDED